MLFASLVACGGDPLRNFGDGGIRDAAPPDLDADAAYFDAPDAGPCSTLATTGPDIIAVNQTGTAPVSTGGTIADAHYRLATIDNYGDNAPTVREMLWFTGTTFERATLGTLSTEDNVEAGTWSTSGTQLTLDPSCGLLVAKTLGYSVGSGTLQLTRTGINGAVVFGYELEP